MAEYDIIIVTVATALITISVYLLYMLSKSRTEKKVDQDYNIVKAIINEFDNREENQNKTIVELMVKIDLLDKKISERSNKEVVFQSNQKGMAIKVLPSSIGVTTKSLTESIGPIEIQILRYISGGPRTSREVQDIIKKSREHTARLLKSLYDKNFLIRENKGKYFVYSITDIGNRFIVQ